MPTPVEKEIDDFLEDEEFEEELEDDEEYEDDDDYDYEDGHSKIIPFAVVGAAFIAFISLGYYAYNSGKENFADEELIVIQAEQTPVKERPVEPGGLQFPYQDKSVFETITADSGGSETVKVVSTIEEPLAIESRVPTVTADAAQQAASQQALDASAELDAKAEAASAEAERAAKAAEEAKAAEIAEAEAIKAAENAKAAALVEKKAALIKEVKPVAVASSPVKAVPKPAAVSSANTGSGAVQLGAFRSEADARTAWGKASAKHGALSGLVPNIVRADLGAKGVFYRLRVAGVDVDKTCASLTAAGQACIRAK